MTRRIPTVFISYAHISSAHKAWVKKLSDALAKRSIATILDQKDLRLGQLIDEFEKNGIGRADRVLVICSDGYVKKADNDPHSGAGGERKLMSLELKHCPGSMKFIPVLRDNITIAKPTVTDRHGGRVWAIMCA